MIKLKTLIKKIKSGEICDKNSITNIINKTTGINRISYKEYHSIPGDGLQEKVNYILKICNFKDKKQKQMTKSKSKTKKVSKVKIETTPSGTYRVRKSKNGVIINRTFTKKKDAIAFRNALYN